MDLNELQFADKYKFILCKFMEFFSVVNFNMSTGLKILKMTAIHVDYTYCLQIMHG
jgi:hypothetical protein